MRPLNNMERIAHLQHRDHHLALSDLLTGYRATPHPATGVAPYDLITGRKIRWKLCDGREDQTYGNPDVLLRDANYKAKYRDSGGCAVKNSFSVGDFVLLRQSKRNKLSTPFEPALYSVVEVKGMQVTIQRATDGRRITRHADHLKNVNQLLQDSEIPQPVDYQQPTPEYGVFIPDSEVEQPPTEQAESHQPNHEETAVSYTQEADQAPDPEVDHQSPPTLRRSARKRAPPKRFGDYLT